jgi:Pyridoxamine 5'-phosphate oxidase
MLDEWSRHAASRAAERVVDPPAGGLRPDGRPHVVPVDGLWLADRCYFGGHVDTVHQRNLRLNSEVVIHLADPVRVIIVEGKAEWVTPDAKAARELAAASKDKHGYAPPPSAYRGGVWALSPRRVLAWDSVAIDPTRFVFGHADKP